MRTSELTHLGTFFFSSASTIGSRMYAKTIATMKGARIPTISWRSQRENRMMLSHITFFASA